MPELSRKSLHTGTSFASALYILSEVTGSVIDHGQHLAVLYIVLRSFDRPFCVTLAATLSP
jgi:hypothetical protein